MEDRRFQCEMESIEKGDSLSLPSRGADPRRRPDLQSSKKPRADAPKFRRIPHYNIQSSHFVRQINRDEPIETAFSSLSLGSPGPRRFAYANGVQAGSFPLPAFLPQSTPRSRYLFLQESLDSLPEKDAVYP